MFEYALVAGLTASGADAYLLHVTTTPSVSYIVRTDGFDCGIMISASHNPYYDNGIKLINDKGQKFDAEVEKQIEMYIDGLTDEIKPDELPWYFPWYGLNYLPVKDDVVSVIVFDHNIVTAFL